MVVDGLSSIESNAVTFSGTNTNFADLQVGTVTASNVAVAEAFSPAFASTPKVIFTLAESGAAASHPGCVVAVGTGSFTMLGTSGLEYNYLARV